MQEAKAIAERTMTGKKQRMFLTELIEKRSMPKYEAKKYYNRQSDILMIETELTQRGIMTTTPTHFKINEEWLQEMKKKFETGEIVFYGY